MKGRITEVSVKGGETNGKEWTRLKFIINGLAYSSFDTDLKSFKAGDWVSFEFEDKGQFKNLTKMELSTPDEAEEVSMVDRQARKDLLIVRQCVLKAASEACAGKNVDEILTMAEGMERWVLR